MIYIKVFVLVIIIFSWFVPVHAEDSSKPELISVIKSCADIGEYDSKNYDIDSLTRRILYTYRNFEIITDSAPNAQVSDNLKMCRSDFIKEAMYNALRITAPSPTPDKLTELGYCENNGYYYFYGGYTKYYATDVHEIVKTIPADDGSMYVIFSDTYCESGKDPVFEYSSAHIAKDELGYYILSINMGKVLDESYYAEDESDDYANPYILSQYLPLIIGVSVLILSFVALYIFILRR